MSTQLRSPQRLKFMKNMLQIILFVWVGVFSKSSFGQEASGGFEGAPRDPKEGAQTPILLEAEDLNFDEASHTIQASGNVQMSLLTEDGVLFLQADALGYNEDTKVATARGNVIFYDKEGTAYKGNEVVLSDDMANGFIKALGMITKDNKRISALSAVRENGNVTRFSKAVYSPCNLCDGDASKPPLWQLKALEIIRDEKAGDVDYYHGWMELLGVPVAYFPYFTHADPTVKRRSGVLSPLMGGTSNMGFFMGIPYYGVISPSEDLTITPTVMTKQYPLLSLEYRRQFDLGLWETEGQITSSKQRTGSSSQLSSHQETRGFVRTHGDFSALEKPWGWGFDVFRASDRNYMRAYNIRNDMGGQPRTLDSSVYLQRLFRNPDGFFNDRSFTRLDTWSFQSNTPGVSQKAMPTVFPRGLYSYRGTPDEYGSAFYADSSVLGLSRRQGANVRRFSVGSGWTLPVSTGIGDNGAFSLFGRGDVYDVDHSQNRVSGDRVNKSVGRVYPQAAFQWQLPLINRHWGTPLILEPKVSLQATPNGLNKSDIPNEDTVPFVLDADNLFFQDRGEGLDLIDWGQRASYGLDFTLLPSYLEKISVFFGQSYALSKNPFGANALGIHRGFSDYVGKVEVVLPNTIRLYSQILLDRQRFNSKRNLLGTTFGPTYFRTTINYIQQEPFNNDLFHQRQIQVNWTSKFTTYWSVHLDMTRNLKRPISTLTKGVGVTYDDECFTFKASFVRNYFHDEKTEPASMVLFNLNFKTLGEVSTGALSPWAKSRQEKAQNL